MCMLRGVRTNIVIDDDLMTEAQRLAGTTTKRATVELALRELVASHRRVKALERIGDVEIEIDLDESRAGRLSG